MPETEETQQYIGTRAGRTTRRRSVESMREFNSQKATPEPLVLRRRSRTPEAAQQMRDLGVRRRLQRPSIGPASLKAGFECSLAEKLQAVIEDVRAEIEEDQELSGAELRELPEFVPEKCTVPQCKKNAVGDTGKCRMHGGRIEDDMLRKDIECTDKHLEKVGYRPDVHPLLYIALAKDGLSDIEIAAHFGISAQKMRSWADQFESFQMAYELGNTLYQAWWQGEGKQNLDNSRYNTGLFKFMTMNLLGWSDKSESKSLTVHAGVLVVPGTKEQSVWEAEYGTHNK